VPLDDGAARASKPAICADRASLDRVATAARDDRHRRDDRADHFSWRSMPRLALDGCDSLGRSALLE
jgi:hypothetical protein